MQKELRKAIDPKDMGSTSVYDPLKAEDKTLFTVLSVLTKNQERYDAALSTLHGEMSDHRTRFATRTQGYITHNVDSHQWYVFNGMLCVRCPYWFLFKCVDLVSQGLEREARLVGRGIKTGVEATCKAIGLDVATLKGKSSKDKVAALYGELTSKLASRSIEVESFVTLTRNLDALMLAVNEQSKLALEARRIRDGQYPIRLLEQVAVGQYGVSHNEEDYDRDGQHVVVKNGTLDLRYIMEPERLLIESLPSHLNTLCMNAFYDPLATCPTVEAQFNQVFLQPGVTEAEAPYLLKFSRILFGGCLDGSTTKETLLMLYGASGTGKSILLNATKNVLGSYGVEVDGNFFIKNPSRGKGDATAHIAKVVRPRLIIATEPPHGELDETFIKSWTGGDAQSYRPPYAKEEKNFKPHGQLMLSTNDLPRLSGDDAVIDRGRIAVHQTSNKIPEATRKGTDKFYQELELENNGYLNMLLQGLRERRTYQDRPPLPASIASDVKEYAEIFDTTRTFFEACNIVTDLSSKEPGITVAKLYELYVGFVGPGAKDTLTKDGLTGKLKGKGFRSKQVKLKGKNERYWLGVKQSTEGKSTPERKETVRTPYTENVLPQTAPVHSSNGHSVNSLDMELEIPEDL